MSNIKDREIFLYPLFFSSIRNHFKCYVDILMIANDFIPFSPTLQIDILNTNNDDIFLQITILEKK